MNRQTQKILIISIAVSLAFFTALADAPFQVEWQQSFGGTNAETFGALTQTIDGGYVLAGTSRSGATGNKTSTNYGDYDYWVLKLDSGGSKLWENDFGATNTENLNALQPTDDGGYLLGGLSFSGISGNKTNTWYGSSDAWLIKLNSTGGMMWQRSFGGTNIDGLTAIRQ